MLADIQNAVELPVYSLRTNVRGPMGSSNETVMTGEGFEL